MRAWMLVVLTVGALALATWLLMRGAASPGAPPHPGDPAHLARRAAPSPIAVRPGEPRPAPTTPPPTAPTGGDLPAAQRPLGAIDYGRAWATLPSRYPTRAFSATTVAVNLSGEPVSSYAGGVAEDPSPPIELRGRVTEDGRPAAGITVVVGGSFVLLHGYVSGHAATVTGDDGRFAIAAPGGTRWALALGPRSWSAVTPIAAGTDATLELPARPAGLEVTVREDGAPIDAMLRLSALGLDAMVSAPDGVFRFAALPPGPARLHVTPSLEFTSGVDDGAAIDVVLVAGELVRRSIELDRADTTVVGVPVVAEGQVAKVIEWALLPPPAPATLADLRARIPNLRRIAGPDVANPYQFHRVTPAGPRVVCVVSTLHHTTGPVAPVVRWGCAPVDVPATGVIEVEVALDRP